MTVQDDLLRIEEQLWTGGVEAYRRHVDDECLLAFTEMTGVHTREQVAASVEGAPRWRDVGMEVKGMVRPAEDVAILTYRGTARRGGEGEEYVALVSSGYVRRADGWKLAFHQQTPLAS